MGVVAGEEMDPLVPGRRTFVGTGGGAASS